jgi:hypothetical protein
VSARSGERSYLNGPVVRKPSRINGITPIRSSFRINRRSGRGGAAPESQLEISPGYGNCDLFTLNRTRAIDSRASCGQYPIP